MVEIQSSVKVLTMERDKFRGLYEQVNIIRKADYREFDGHLSCRTVLVTAALRIRLTISLSACSSSASMHICYLFSNHSNGSIVT